MHRLRMFSWLGLFVASAVASADDPPEVAGQTDPAAASRETVDDEIRGLIPQLGDEEFANRERASNRLIEIGVPAIPALQMGADHPDREIQYRCRRILGIVSDLDFQRRLAAFAAGRGDGSDLPGWKKFEPLFGNDGESRAMFVEMQTAEYALMQAIENGPRGVADVVQTRCLELQQNQRALGQSISLGSLLSLLFAVLDEDVHVSMQIGSQLCSFCYQNTLTDALNDPEKQRFVRQVLGAWIKRSQGWTSYQTMALAMRLGFPEGLVPAREALKNPAEQPFVRQAAILTVAKLGGEEHIELLEGLLQDTVRCSAQRVNNVTYETQLRDVALAAILILKKQDPKRFGFNRIQRNEQTVFVTSTVGFENEDRRKQVFSKYEPQTVREADADPPQSGPASGEPVESASPASRSNG